MRVLVTGARGFVGSRLVPHLEGRGATVVARDQELDVTDGDALRSALVGHRIDAVVHLAAIAFIPDSIRDPDRVFRVNYLGCHALLRVALEQTRRIRVLLVGSGAVYGLQAPDAQGLDESDPMRPESPYATTKAASDLLGAAFAARGLDVIRARPFNHIGPGQDDAYVAPAFARQLAEMEAGRRETRLTVGNTESVRDFLDVDDVVDAYARLLEPDVPCGAYNVCRGEPITIGELLEGLLHHASVQPRIEVDPTLFRPTDRWVGSSRKLSEVTGWEPRVPLEDTLGKVLDDWRRRVSAS